MSKTGFAVAVYDTHGQTETAVKNLANAGFDMKTISILGRDYQTKEYVVGYRNAGDRAKFFGKLGAFWGDLSGILFRSALRFVPIVGHIVVLGSVAATVFDGLQGAVLGGGRRWRSTHAPRHGLGFEFMATRAWCRVAGLFDSEAAIGSADRGCLLVKEGAGHWVRPCTSSRPKGVVA